MVQDSKSYYRSYYKISEKQREKNNKALRRFVNKFGQVVFYTAKKGFARRVEQFRKRVKVVKSVGTLLKIYAKAVMRLEKDIRDDPDWQEYWRDNSFKKQVDDTTHKLTHYTPDENRRYY